MGPDRQRISIPDRRRERLAGSSIAGGGFFAGTKGFISTGHGNDTIGVIGGEITGKKVSVKTGSGDDTVSLEDGIENVDLNLGGGDDYLRQIELSTGDASLNGGGGSDTLGKVVDSRSASERLVVKNFEILLP